MAIGQKLEEARNRKGISIREASESTKIRGDYLSAFEAGNFDLSIPDVYLRGFVKLYARFLDLDHEATVSDLDIELGANPRKVSRKSLGSISKGDSSDSAEYSTSTKIKKSNLAMYRDGFLVAGLSPKALVTFGTVFIQFINFENNIISQFLILTFTWVFLDFLSLMMYGLAARKISIWLKGNPRLLNTISACVLIIIAIIIGIKT